MRTFIAVELDEAVRERLGEAQERLRAAGCKAKWVRPELMHVTLKFLGEIAPETAGAVAAAMAEAAGPVAPFDFELAMLGTFPPRGAPRVVWAGIEDASGGLTRLQEGLDRGLQALGFEREKRAFRPHLTLGRVKERRGTERLRALIEHEAATRFGKQRVEGLVLLQSVLSPNGPTYTPLRRVPAGRED